MQVHDHYTECDIFCTGHGVCFLTENKALAYLWKADAVIYARVIYTCWTKQIMLSMGKQVTWVVQPRYACQTEYCLVLKSENLDDEI